MQKKKHLNPFEDQPNGMTLNSQLSFILLNMNYNLQDIRAIVKYSNISSDENNLQVYFQLSINYCDDNSCIHDNIIYI